MKLKLQKVFYFQVNNGKVHNIVKRLYLLSRTVRNVQYNNSKNVQQNNHSSTAGQNNHPQTSNEKEKQSIIVAVMIGIAIILHYTYKLSRMSRDYYTYRGSGIGR